MALNNTLHQVELTDIYRTFHPKAAKYTFFSNAHRPHDTTQNKTQKIQENWNRIKHFLGQQGLETTNQHQGKKLKNTQIHGDGIACY